MSSTVEKRARVLIAGAGIAGIEAALALRAFAGPAAHVHLLDPGRSFRIPATATGRAFGIGSTIDHPLADVAARAGATLTHGRLASVDPGRHLAMLAGGELLTYEALIVAVGARAEPSLPGALTFAGHADADSVRDVVDEIARSASRGAATRLAIVVPEGCGWPLAAYELALMAGEHLTAAGSEGVVEISIVTAEDSPLGVFGPEVSASVERSLGRVGVVVHAGTVVRGWRWGELELAGGGVLHADRVIALPVQRGPSVDGLPTDAMGFVRTESDGAVAGAPDVWAVGDSSSYPVKQGGIACQQADSVAAAITRRLGVETEEMPFQPTLRVLWWPVAKVAGRFLAPFLQGWPADASLVDFPSPAGLRR